MSIFDILLIIGLGYPAVLLLSGAIPALVRTLKAWDKNFEDIVMVLWFVCILGGLMVIGVVSLYIEANNFTLTGIIPDSAWGLQHWVMLAFLYFANFNLTVTYYGFHANKLHW